MFKHPIKPTTPDRPMPAALHAELRRTAPFQSAEEEAYLSVLRTADGFRRGIAQLLKPHGLTPSQYNVLRILRGAGGEGHLIGAIGERLVEQDPDVPRLIDRMEKKGWVVRRREADDRRCVRVTLTPAGRALVGKLDAPMHALHHAQFKALKRPALRELLLTLALLRHPDDAE
jgi:DNA-binding MarR family transcriptional regulator